MKKTPKIIAWCILFLSVVVIVEANEEDDIADYISDYLRIYSKRRHASIKLVPYLVEQSRRYNIDPWLVAVTVSSESSWVSSARGRIGEAGLTQVHGFCAKGANLNTHHGQLLAGIKCLAHAHDKCDSTLHVINAYLTGKCSPVIKTARRRYKKYKNVKRDYSKR